MLKIFIKQKVNLSQWWVNYCYLKKEKKGILFEEECYKKLAKRVLIYCEEWWQVKNKGQKQKTWISYFSIHFFSFKMQWWQDLVVFIFEKYLFFKTFALKETEPWLVPERLCVAVFQEPVGPQRLIPYFWLDYYIDFKCHPTPSAWLPLVRTLRHIVWFNDKCRSCAACWLLRAAHCQPDSTEKCTVQETESLMWMPFFLFFFFYSFFLGILPLKMSDGTLKPFSPETNRTNRTL